MVVSFLVTVPTLTWVLCMTFELCAHVPPSNLSVSLGFRMVVLLPRRALGRHPS
jgi:hypothetical protein